ncbi:hypothetical protein QTL95_17065 [Rhizobium sp. S152]|uniref:hypothetical protein n=1 Tax=Rhizobium sp. S152 TaxID=3055038 RepID=UPI0025A9CECD|nr:hypothetical protein [Rhizobium sp. S152]MDM9627615.1 hypothetical protein [Rhizobium sp. S152]
MFNISVRLALAASVLSALSVGARAADDRYVNVFSNKGWQVSYDKEQGSCIAVPQTSQGFFLVRSDASNMRLIFPTADLPWIQDAKSYDVIIFTDGGRWTGSMDGWRKTDAIGLVVSNPSDKFLAALRSSNRMRIQAKGTTIGPYSLSGSSQTIGMLSNCIQMKDAGKFAPPKPQELPFRQPFTWSKDDYGKTFSGEGWTAKLDGQKNLDDTYSAYLRVSRDKGFETTLKLETTEGGFGTIVVAPLQGTEPGLLFSSFTGGAHCCTSAVAAISEGKSVNSVPIGDFDGEGLSVEDLDSDGTYELVSVDQRFLYAFSGYSDSNPPMQIFRMEDGKPVDVTRKSQFQPLLRADFVRRLNRMNGSEDDVTVGVAAGLVATGSLIGSYDAAKGMVPDALLSSIDDFYRVCESPQCRPAKTYKSFAEALSDKLGKWGYDLSPHIDEESLSMFGKLTAQPFGEPGDVEGSCKLQPTTFSIKEKAVSFSGYEMGCEIASAASFGNAVVAMAFCSGEGENWIQHYLIEPEGDELRMSQWDGDISDLLLGKANTRKLMKCAPDKTESKSP